MTRFELDGKQLDPSAHHSLCNRDTRRGCNCGAHTSSFESERETRHALGLRTPAPLSPPPDTPRASHMPAREPPRVLIVDSQGIRFRPPEGMPSLRRRASTLFVVRGRSWFVLFSLAVLSGIVTWLLLH